MALNGGLFAWNLHRALRIRRREQDSEELRVRAVTSIALATRDQLAAELAGRDEFRGIVLDYDPRRRRQICVRVKVCCPAHSIMFLRAVARSLRHAFKTQGPIN